MKVKLGDRRESAFQCELCKCVVGSKFDVFSFASCGLDVEEEVKKGCTLCSVTYLSKLGEQNFDKGKECY